MLNERKGSSMGITVEERRAVLVAKQVNWTGGGPWGIKKEGRTYR